MLNLLFVGDIAVQGDGKLDISNELEKKMQGYDLRVCNFEGAVGDYETCTPASKAGPPLLQNFSSYAVVERLGFNLFGLANNHVLDFGKKCLHETIDTLEAENGITIGVQCGKKKAYEPYVLEKDGLKIAVFSAAENSFGTLNEYVDCGHAHLFSRELLIQIRKYKKICDKVILLAHAGLENLNFPMPEWVDAYKNFIDNGVDVVIGHHPHVVQGWEAYGDGLIFYSLGNFLWQKRKQNFVNIKTIMVGLRIDNNEVTYEIIPVKTEDNQLMLNDDEEYNELLKEYCAPLKTECRSELIKIVDDFCVGLYKSAFENYIFSTCGCRNIKSIKDYIKSIVRITLCKQKINHNFVYHNSAVETNRWVISRSIQCLKSEDR